MGKSGSCSDSIWSVQRSKDMIPLLRGDLPFIGKISIFINHLRLNDIEYLLGVYVSAFMTFALIAVYQVDTFFKVSDRIDGISVIDLVSAGIQYQKFIKHLEDVGRRLMNDDEHPL